MMRLFDLEFIVIKGCVRSKTENYNKLFSGIWGTSLPMVPENASRIPFFILPIKKSILSVNEKDLHLTNDHNQYLSVALCDIKVRWIFVE